MRQLIFVIFLLGFVQVNAQIETIKIKKEESSSILTEVRLAGVKEGAVSLTKLCSDNKFKIINNPGKYKVYFGILKFKDAEGNYTEWVNSTEDLNKAFLNYLLGPNSASKTQLIISDIKARDNKEQELKLNDIMITIVK